MKKVVSIVLAFVMILSTFATVSAASVNDLTSYIPNPLEMELGVGVLARKSGTTDAYTSALEILEKELLNGIGIDYKATLDMEPVRLLFDKQFITTVLTGDPTAQGEFNAATVDTEVSVKITYPESADFVSDLTSAGVLDAGSIFSEKSRTRNGNVLTIVYKNQDDLTVGELTEHKDSYLKNISFVLENDLSYDTEGYHEVKVEMSGSTNISFASKTQTVAYSGAASHIVSADTKHVLEVVPAVPATCEKEGLEEGVKCKTHEGYQCANHGVVHDGYDCGARGVLKPTKTIPKLPHNTVHVDEEPATCYATGLKEHWICLICKKDFKDEAATQLMSSSEIVIAKKAHTPTVISAIPATCTDSGLGEGSVCSVCGHAETRKVIPALGHSERVIPAVAPTCTTAGSTEGKECSRCSRVLVATKPIAAHGHSLGEWQVITPATENSEGLKRRECSECDYAEELSIPKLVHTCKVDEKAAVVTKNPTCTDAGAMQNYCACGEAVGEPVVIPALGHNATKIDAVVATCTDKGMIAHWSCANCQGLFRDEACTKQIQSAEVPVDTNNHGTNKREIPAIAATCEKDGLTAGEKCVACNTITVPQIVVPKGHKFEVAAAKAATCDGKGVVEHLHCSVCNKDYSHDGRKELTTTDFELEALGHALGMITVVVHPTEEMEGKGVRECTRCDFEKEVTIAKLEHKHNEVCEEVIIPATCTTNGVKREVHTCCGEVVEGKEHIVIPAKHTPKKIAAVAADCFNTGVKEHYYCTVCEKLFTSEACTVETTIEELTTDKLVHDWEKLNNNITKCKICNEVVHVHKGESTDNIDVKEHGGMKDNKDKVKEERLAEENEGRKVTVESSININNREISATLEDEIFMLEEVSEETLAFDIILEKVTTYSDVNTSEVLDVDKEIVAEVDDLIILEITIPDSMKDLEDFMVHRLISANGTEVIEKITTRANADGEYIVIAPDKSKVTLYVKKVAEYALAGYGVKVNPAEPSQGSGLGGGLGGLQPTIKFNSNGGTKLENIIVKAGEAIKLPIPEREGYTFAGWYTDISLTIPFDPEAKISGTLTLYAKWIEGSAGPCDGTEAAGCPCLKFVDLDPSLWYHVGVDYVLNNGLMVGTEETVFEPESSLTRAMLVTVLWRAEGKKQAARECKFADVEQGSYYEEAVAWAEECGIVTGYNDTEFGPHDNILREQIAAIMYRYSKFKGYDVSAGENTNILSYADVAEISEYAISAMQFAVGTGLMNGRTESTLNPLNDTTRAEIAVILYRFFTAHK